MSSRTRVNGDVESTATRELTSCRAKPTRSAALASSDWALRNKGSTMEYPPKSRLRHDVVTFNCPHCQGI